MAFGIAEAGPVELARLKTLQQQGIITHLGVRRVTQAMNEMQMLVLDIEFTGPKYRVVGS